MTRVPGTPPSEGPMIREALAARLRTEHDTLHARIYRGGGIEGTHVYPHEGVNLLSLLREAAAALSAPLDAETRAGTSLLLRRIARLRDAVEHIIGNDFVETYSPHHKRGEPRPDPQPVPSAAAWAQEVLAGDDALARLAGGSDRG